MTIRNITDALAACDIPLPESAQRWLDLRDALRLKAQETTVEQPHEAVDRLTMDNLHDVVATMTRQATDHSQAERVTGQLIEALGNRAVKAAESEADSLIAAARKGFDAAAKTVARHAAAFDPSEAPAQVLDRGPEASAAWVAIQEASAALDQHLVLWSALYGTPSSVDVVVKTFKGDHWLRMNAEALFEGERRWHALVSAGLPLRFNTRPESQALIAATPERQQEWVKERKDGFVGYSAVPQ